jgi:hypothetical protein
MNRRERAFTLVEMLVYIPLFIILMLMLIQFSHRVLKVNRLAGRGMEDLLVARQALGDLSGAIRGAERVVPQYKAYRSGAGTIVLACPGGELRVYRLAGARLERVSVRGGVEEPRTLARGIRELAFSYDSEKPDSAKVVGIQLGLRKGAPEARSGLVLSTKAALRNRKEK